MHVLFLKSCARAGKRPLTLCARHAPHALPLSWPACMALGPNGQIPVCFGITWTRSCGAWPRPMGLEGTGVCACWARAWRGSRRMPSHSCCRDRSPVHVEQEYRYHHHQFQMFKMLSSISIDCKCGLYTHVCTVYVGMRCTREKHLRTRVSIAYTDVATKSSLLHSPNARETAISHNDLSQSFRCC